MALAFVVEHGQTALDAFGESHGVRDTPLDSVGRRQAVALGQRLRLMSAHQRPDVLLASDRKRTQQTARIAGHIAGLPVGTAPELRALHAGDLGQGPEHEVAERLKPYFDHPERPLPTGETVGGWRARHLDFMRRAAEKYARPAFVTHSNVIGSVKAGPEGARRAMANAPPPARLERVEISKGEKQ